MVGGFSVNATGLLLALVVPNSTVTTPFNNDNTSAVNANISAICDRFSTDFRLLFDRFSTVFRVTFGTSQVLQQKNQWTVRRIITIVFVFTMMNFVHYNNMLLVWLYVCLYVLSELKCLIFSHPLINHNSPHTAFVLNVI